MGQVPIAVTRDRKLKGRNNHHIADWGLLPSVRAATREGIRKKRGQSHENSPPAVISVVLVVGVLAQAQSEEKQVRQVVQSFYGGLQCA